MIKMNFSVNMSKIQKTYYDQDLYRPKKRKKNREKSI